MQIRKMYGQMYQETQNTMIDNVIIDPDREEIKLNLLKRELYAAHMCEKSHDQLIKCLNSTKDFCIDEDFGYKVCLKQSLERH